MARKPEASKLFNLKEWLTLDDAAKHLSIVFGEEVTRADVLRLALDKRLTLSVNFVNHALARKGKVTPIEQTGLFPPSVIDKINVLLGLPRNVAPRADVDKPVPDILGNTDELALHLAHTLYRGNGCLVLNEAVVWISGVWDLPMTGAEERDVEHCYQMETGGPSVTLSDFVGAFVERGDVVCQLQSDFDEDGYSAGSRANGERLEQRILEEKIPEERADELRAHYNARRQKLKDRWKRNPSGQWHPAAGLPADAVYVVRTASLRAFEQSVLDNPSNDKPLGQREEATLLNIAGGLLDLMLSKSPGGQPQSVFKSQAAIIDALVATYPGKPGISKRTLEEKLALARRFLET